MNWFVIQETKAQDKYNSPDFYLKPNFYYSFSIIIKPNAQGRRYKCNAKSRKDLVGEIEDKLDSKLINS